MSLRSILIIASLLANIFLLFYIQGGGRRIKEARQIALLEDADLNKVRELAGRVRPASGLNPTAVNQDLAMLQTVKTAVAEQVSGGRADLKCPFASRGELDQMLGQMQDYRKKMDALIAGGGRSTEVKEDIMRAVEQEAAKIKVELMSLCAR